jgi:hypothetical protein
MQKSVKSRIYRRAYRWRVCTKEVWYSDSYIIVEQGRNLVEAICSKLLGEARKVSYKKTKTAKKYIYYSCLVDEYDFYLKIPRINNEKEY